MWAPRRSAGLLGFPREEVSFTAVRESPLSQPQLLLLLNGDNCPVKQVAWGLGAVCLNRLRAPPVGMWADEEGSSHQEAKRVLQLLADTVARSVATGRGIRLVPLCPKATY